MKNNNMPFSIARKGYNRFEVEFKLRQLESEKAALENETNMLKKQLEGVVSQLGILEERRSLIEDTLINAEISAREIVSRAEEKAKEIINKREAESIMLEKRLEDRKVELEDVLKKVEYILESQLALIKVNNSPEDEQNN